MQHRSRLSCMVPAIPAGKCCAVSAAAGVGATVAAHIVERRAGCRCCQADCRIDGLLLLLLHLSALTLRFSNIQGMHRSKAVVHVKVLDQLCLKLLQGED